MNHDKFRMHNALRLFGATNPSLLVSEETALHEIKGKFLAQTRGGKTMDFAGLLLGEKQPVDIADIAEHLSKVNRYGGATSRPYSVLEHLDLCDMIVQAVAGAPSFTFGRSVLIDVRRCTLLHDAAEYMLGDMLGPLKRFVGLYTDVLERLEAEMQDQIECMLGATPLPWSTMQDLHHVDITARCIERDALMGSEAHSWGIKPMSDLSSDEYGRLVRLLQEYAPTPAEMREVWLKKLEETKR